jgi:hypothetical protein
VPPYDPSAAPACPGRSASAPMPRPARPKYGRQAHLARSPTPLLRQRHHYGNSKLGLVAVSHDRGGVQQRRHRPKVPQPEAAPPPERRAPASPPPALAHGFVELELTGTLRWPEPSGRPRPWLTNTAPGWRYLLAAAPNRPNNHQRHRGDHQRHPTTDPLGSGSHRNPGRPIGSRDLPNDGLSIAVRESSYRWANRELTGVFKDLP